MSVGGLRVYAGRCSLLEWSPYFILAPSKLGPRIRSQYMGSYVSPGMRDLACVACSYVYNIASCSHRRRGVIRPYLHTMHELVRVGDSLFPRDTVFGTAHVSEVYIYIQRQTLGSAR